MLRLSGSNQICKLSGRCSVKLKIILFLLLLTAFLQSISAAQTKVYFSPGGGCTDAIVQEVGRAQKTIDIMMYSFTSRPIIQELEKAKERGVKVRILLDKAQATQKYAKGRYLAQRGFDVKYDAGKGLMHNKVGIFDGKVLITGS